MRGNPVTEIYYTVKFALHNMQLQIWSDNTVQCTLARKENTHRRTSTEQALFNNVTTQDETEPSLCKLIPRYHL